MGGREEDRDRERERMSLRDHRASGPRFIDRPALNGSTLQQKYVTLTTSSQDHRLRGGDFAAYTALS